MSFLLSCSFFQCCNPYAYHKLSKYDTLENLPLQLFSRNLYPVIVSYLSIKDTMMLAFCSQELYQVVIQDEFIMECKNNSILYHNFQCHPECIYWNHSCVGVKTEDGQIIKKITSLVKRDKLQSIKCLHGGIKQKIAFLTSHSSKLSHFKKLLDLCNDFNFCDGFGLDHRECFLRKMLLSICAVGNIQCFLFFLEKYKKFNPLDIPFREKSLWMDIINVLCRNEHIEILDFLLNFYIRFVIFTLSDTIVVRVLNSIVKYQQVSVAKWLLKWIKKNGFDEYEYVTHLLLNAVGSNTVTVDFFKLLFPKLFGSAPNPSKAFIKLMVMLIEKSVNCSHIESIFLCCSLAIADTEKSIKVLMKLLNAVIIWQNDKKNLHLCKFETLINIIQKQIKKLEQIIQSKTLSRTFQYAYKNNIKIENTRVDLILLEKLPESIGTMPALCLDICMNYDLVLIDKLVDVGLFTFYGIGTYDIVKKLALVLPEHRRKVKNWLQNRLSSRTFKKVVANTSFLAAYYDSDYKQMRTCFKVHKFLINPKKYWKAIISFTPSSTNKKSHGKAKIMLSNIVLAHDLREKNIITNEEEFFDEILSQIKTSTF